MKQTRPAPTLGSRIGSGSPVRGRAPGACLCMHAMAGSALAHLTPPAPLCGATPGCGKRHPHRDGGPLAWGYLPRLVPPPPHTHTPSCGGQTADPGTHACTCAKYCPPARPPGTLPRRAKRRYVRGQPPVRRRRKGAREHHVSPRRPHLRGLPRKPLSSRRVPLHARVHAPAHLPGRHAVHRQLAGRGLVRPMPDWDLPIPRRPPQRQLP